MTTLNFNEKSSIKFHTKHQDLIKKLEIIHPSVENLSLSESDDDEDTKNSPWFEDLPTQSYNQGRGASWGKSINSSLRQNLFESFPTEPGPKRRSVGSKRTGIIKKPTQSSSAKTRRVTCYSDFDGFEDGVKFSKEKREIIQPMDVDVDVDIEMDNPKCLSEYQVPSSTDLKVTIKKFITFAEWKWIEGGDDSCGICRMPFEACCVDCKTPGDECPLVLGACKHPFHMHCIVKWTEDRAQSAKPHCPLCRQEWKFASK
uniref:Anaphase-promoting complex subunit 11 n=1 Tax=Strongyloides papillosus TaxID=174720 RepID=A0A0N5BS10_STREA